MAILSPAISVARYLIGRRVSDTSTIRSVGCNPFNLLAVIHLTMCAEVIEINRCWTRLPKQVKPFNINF